MIFRKIVMSKTTITNGRIVITNGMITFEQHASGINMNGVRERETNSVDTRKRSPRVVKFHSRARRMPQEVTLQVVWQIVHTIFTSKYAIQLRNPSIGHTLSCEPAISYGLNVHHGNTLPLSLRNGIQGSANISNEHANLRCIGVVSKITDPPHEQY